jgi:xanthine dehydrogenase accessory factor
VEDVYQEICNLQRQGRCAVLATIIEAHGSIPSVVGAKMLVRDDGSIVGTIGGGCVEDHTRMRALQVMKEEKAKILDFSLDQDPGDDPGLVCGGTLRVFMEPVLPAPLLYVFGAGHVGLSIYKVALLAGFQPIVVDDRQSYANCERFPDAREVHAADIEQTMAKLAPPDSAFIAIATRGHRHDMRVLRWALKTKARYIGMIGSGRKTLTAFEELKREGHTAESFERVYSPIGLQLGAVTPEEIAIAVVAEMIAVRRRCEVPLPHSRNRIRTVYESLV